MGSLDAYYLHEHENAPITLTTPDDIDALIERVRAESPQAAPILMDVHLSGDPFSQGLDIGVRSNCGIVRYSGDKWPRGVISIGEQSELEEEVAYFYMGNWRGFPSNSEVPLNMVRQALKEFMETDGKRPECIQWQPDE